MVHSPEATALIWSVSPPLGGRADRKSTRLNSSHLVISYAAFCLKKTNARATYRDASEEGRGLALGDRTIEQRINLLLSMAQLDAMQACQSAPADTLNPFAAQMDCGTLFAW